MGIGHYSWRSPKILVALGLVFLCGSFAGALGARYRLMKRAAPTKAALSWTESKDITLQKFRKELNLTPEQSQEVEVVLDDFMLYYQTLQAQMDDVRASGKDRIVRILNPDQRERFNRMMSELQARQQLR